ncbi:MAG: bifunctional phosphoribosylaminoimidazolecarboxamide formyltransferase/inosine monophosphate cyclohydrolase [Prochlorococcus sp. SP3034]|nr:bifunctional phosphoribosylaminoimidazolecarboxamide formyltransferase/inosine monophosphate cyclohydrolase [Prochlorococcus sp. SP3034]
MSPLALISVSDKTNIIQFSKVLIEQFDYKIISSGGTAKHLKEANIPVIKVSEYTNSPEILDGRVKTLHPKIHGGILAKRNNDNHIDDLNINKIKLIDLVVVNLYPFQKKIEEKCEWDEAIENIDIGGPSMIRSAAKNHKDVSVLVNPNQYNHFLEELSKGNIDNLFRTKLAYEAFQHTANYDANISNWISEEKEFSPSIHIETYPIIKNLRYGENPHQEARWYGLKNIGWNAAKQLQGKSLSYNNLLDLESALATVMEFGYDDNHNVNYPDSANAAVILKHNNPCGAAIADSLTNAFAKALKCDSTSAFGGIVAFNKTVDSDTAALLSNIFLECVVAPSFTKEALNILSKKINLRLLELDKYMLHTNPKGSCKSIMGGLLIQDFDKSIINSNEWVTVTKEKPSDLALKDLKFSWQICKHVKSNAIVIAKDQMTIGIGAGQMNRIGAAKIALKNANKDCKEAALASDGFFPFADTVELASEFGIKAIIQPGGSLRDKESIEMCNQKGISMIFTNKRHFLH